MLKVVRVIVAVAIFSLITAWFLDFTNLVPDSVGKLTTIQFFPAMLGKSVAILAGILVLTILFGRFYCSTICPLGILQDLFIRVRRWWTPKKKFTYRKGWTWLRWTMGVLCLLPFFGILHILFDPYAIFGRIATQLFRPIYIFGNNVLASICTRYENYTFYYVEYFGVTLGAVLLSVAMLVLIGWLATRFGRLYCNTLCPVGAVLGGLSKFAIFRVRIDPSKCVSCGLCEAVCKSECIDSKEKIVETSRCVDCFNCLSSCRKGAIRLELATSHKSTPVAESAVESTKTESATEPTKAESAKESAARAVGATTNSVKSGSQEAPKSQEALKSPKASRSQSSPSDSSESVGVSRRGIFAWAASAAGVTLATGAASPQEPQVLYNTGKTPYSPASPVSPPGALAIRHLQHHCTACQLCVSKCPSHVLRPATLEYGLAGFMQPLMDFTKGFCNYDCVRCGEVCPNHAIRLLSVKEKHETQAGKAVFIRENCVVPVDGTNCGACAEHCPTQAVHMVPFEGSLTIPELDVELCVGCGACEHICPVRPFRAIHVEGCERHGVAKQPPEEKKETVVLDGFGF